MVYRDIGQKLHHTPNCFFHKNWDFCTVWNVCMGKDCMLSLDYITFEEIWAFLELPIFQSRLQQIHNAPILSKEVYSYVHFYILWALHIVSFNKSLEENNAGNGNDSLTPLQSEWTFAVSVKSYQIPTKSNILLGSFLGCETLPLNNGLGTYSQDHCT